MKRQKILSSFLAATLITSFFVRTVNALEITISENGSGSSSEVVTNTSSQATVVQSNNSQVTNDVSVDADTGGNTVTENGGDIQVTTGGVVSETAVTNSGNLSSTELSCCETSETVINISGNGTDSVNQVSLTDTLGTTVNVSQHLDSKNEVNGYSNSGKNAVEDNMGSVSITTGGIQVSEGIFNDPINIVSVRVERGFGDISIRIKENGSGSENIVGLNLENESDIVVDQRAEFENVSDWYLETGDNEAKDNLGDVEIKTGDIEFEAFIKNFANIGGVNISTCCEVEVKPNDDPGDESEDSVPGGGGDNGGSNSSSGGSILPSAAATEAGGPGIMGLSDTSSEGAKALFFWISLAFIAFGGKMITEELLPKTSGKKG